METQLINNETSLSQVQIGTELFTVTDKRLIYDDVGQNFFIGISELSGAQIENRIVSYSRFEKYDRKGSVMWMIIAGTILYQFYFHSSTSGLFTEDEKTTGMMLGIAFGFLLTSFVVGVLMLILRAINNSTRYNKNQVLFSVQKKDNSYFHAKYYEPEFHNNLAALAKVINSAVYK